MAHSEAIERSRIALESALEGTLHGKIQFKDVRSIDIVNLNPRVFSENVPVYFRVDLLRAIAADHILKSKETEYFVYGDIDMEPLSANELFDKRTVNFLKDFGFVMAKGGHLGFENGFQILSGHHPRFLDSHRKVIVDLSLEMALEQPHLIKEQQIYDTYPAMVTHLLDEDGRYGKLTLAKKDLSQFRYDRWKDKAHINLPLGNGLITLKETMPTKPVNLPPSHF